MTAIDAPARPLPAGSPATEPPEERGLRRDEVRLLVARPEGMEHTRFSAMGEHLGPGDVLVVNTSATRPAALDAVWRRRQVVVHFSTELDDGRWLIEIRQPDGSGPVLDAAPGDIIDIADHGHVRLEAARTPGGPRRLWRAAVHLPGGGQRFLARYGRPITYGYVEAHWPLEKYQSVFARFGDPSGSSAESPSAARPFTPELVTALVASGVVIVPVTLHTGVSSLERHEPPLPERYQVPFATASIVSAAHRGGSRVIAVGTTVARALETVTDRHGRMHPGRGWTELILGPDRRARLLNGLVTGWHPPEASHLLLLEAVAGTRMVEEAYHAAATAGYRWHEFGDSCLFLP